MVSFERVLPYLFCEMTSIDFDTRLQYLTVFRRDPEPDGGLAQSCII